MSIQTFCLYLAGVGFIAFLCGLVLYRKYQESIAICWSEWVSDPRSPHRAIIFHSVALVVVAVFLLGYPVSKLLWHWDAYGALGVIAVIWLAASLVVSVPLTLRDVGRHLSDSAPLATVVSAACVFLLRVLWFAVIPGMLVIGWDLAGWRTERAEVIGKLEFGPGLSRMPLFWLEAIACLVCSVFIALGIFYMQFFVDLFDERVAKKTKEW